MDASFGTNANAPAGEDAGRYGEWIYQAGVADVFNLRVRPGLASGGVLEGI